MIGIIRRIAADWAAWHLPGGPVGPAVGPASRWAAMSNVEVGHTTYPTNMVRVEREG